MTIVELLVVIVILGILVSILVPSLGKGKQLAEALKNTSNLRNIAAATLTWAGDNGNKLPSPVYPGGNLSDEEDFPKYWDLEESGLWLDGVVFGHMYLSEQAAREEDEAESGGDDDNRDASSGGYAVDKDGTHLIDTLFVSNQSIRKDPEEKDMHKHSYAMNTNLQYDRKYESFESDDPYMTEKTLSNILFMPNALLYIENKKSNLIDFEDRDDIIETMEERWDGSKSIAAFLDGHAERLNEDQIPEEDVALDQESSRFWRGVDSRQFNGSSEQ